MAKIPSIKGSVFSGVVEALKKLLAEGELSLEQAGRWLEEGDLALLEASISVAGWYDIRIFSRMSELLRDVAGGGSNEYLRSLGRESARRLRDVGLYSQIEYLQNTRASQETERRARFEALGRDLSRLTTLSGSIYNFGKWSVEVDPQHPFRYVIVVSDAASFSDVICWRADGFINQMASFRDHLNLWTWRRVGRDLVRFSMTRDF